MVSKSESSNALRETLSSLMDGELPAEGVRAPCSQWRADAQARDAWHTYHLIGDVLRSDDLASAPVRDEAFLQRLRGRLVTEPVPMAPLPAGPRPGIQEAPQVTAPVAFRRSASRRFAPVAIAAGVVVVAGVVGVMRVAGLGASDGQSMASGFDGQVVVSAPMPGSVVPVAVVRDAGLDRYIRAHRKLANGMAEPDRAGAPMAVVYETR